MPTVTIIEFFDSSDGHILGEQTGTVINDFPTATSETDGNPLLVGGRQTSGGFYENKGFLEFGNLNIPKNSKITDAKIKVLAKVKAGGAQVINFSAWTTANTLFPDQQRESSTTFFTQPVFGEKGSIALTAGETTFVSKEANVRALVQELVNTFNYADRERMHFRMTNKTFIDKFQASPYPPSISTISATIYDFDTGGTNSPQLTIVYENPCTETFCEDFSTYSVTDIENGPGIDDPALFGNQTVADSHYPTSDTARIRVNPPFPNARLDISCPPAVAHNAGGTGDNNGGTIVGGVTSTEAWNYRFKIDITSFVINTDPTGQSIHIGISDSDETVFSDAGQNYIGFAIKTAGSSSSFELIGASGIGPDTAGAIEGTFTTLPSTGVFFVEVIRQGNDGSGFSHISCALFNDKDYTDLIERVNGITPSTIPTMNHFKFMAKNADGTGNGDITVEWGQLSTADPQGLISGNSRVLFDSAISKTPSVELRDFEDDFEVNPNILDRFIADNWNDVGTGFGVDAVKFGGVKDANDWSADISTSNNQTQASQFLGFTIGGTGQLSNTWVARFKLDIENLVSGTSAVNNGVFFGITSTVLVTNGWSNASMDSLGLIIFKNNTTASFNLSHSSGVGVTPVDQNLVPFTTAVPAVGQFFIEMKRTSATSFTVNIFSDSAFTQLIESQTATHSVTETMRVFKMLSRDNGTGSDSTLNGFIDDFQFFAFKSSFPATGWGQTGTRVPVNQSTAFIDIDSTKEGLIHQISRDLGAGNVSDKKWTLRFDCEILTADIPAVNDSVFVVSLSDSDDTVGVLSAQDTIAFEYNNQGGSGIKRFVLRTSDGVALFPGTLNTFVTSGAHDVGDGRFFVELKRNSATEAICNIYSDPDFTNLLHTSGATTIPATLTGLRFIRVSSRDDVTSAGILTARIGGETTQRRVKGSIQFWNGQEELVQDNRWRAVG